MKTYASNIGNRPRVNNRRTPERESEEVVSNQSEGLLSVLAGFSNIHHSTSSQREGALDNEHCGLDLESSGGVRSSENRDSLNNTKGNVQQGTVLGGEAKTFDQGGAEGVGTARQL